ncbi:MAG: hypothetical protein JEZ02_12800 [Desulfatibacillum sp.]|nr:hypothetical protein [Desulfatibacillum sp.]
MATDFKDKHAPDSRVDPELEQALKRVSVKGALPCAVAYALSRESEYSMGDLGRASDLLGMRLAKCQMGLFGYQPNKKIVKPATIVAPELETAIKGQVKDGRIPCIACWNIAKDLEISKMSVSAACETLGIKIKPCQLGAF